MATAVPEDQDQVDNEERAEQRTESRTESERRHLLLVVQLITQLQMEITNYNII